MMRVAISVLMLVAVPALAAAQDTEAAATTQASTSVTSSAGSASATTDATADARIDRAFARVEAEGISSASLTDRVQLGQARGVAPARIAAAVENRAEALVTARDALRASSAGRSTATLELGADAIESGAQAAHVAEVVAAFEGATQSRALAALGALAADGTIGIDAVSSVQAALDAGLGSRVGAAGPDVAAGADGAVDAAAGVGSGAVSASGAASAVVRGALPR